MHTNKRSSAANAWSSRIIGPLRKVGTFADTYFNLEIYLTTKYTFKLINVPRAYILEILLESFLQGSGKNVQIKNHQWLSLDLHTTVSQEE